MTRIVRFIPRRFEAQRKVGATKIARALNTREVRISKWRVRFEREGLSGLHDDFRAGRPVEVVENFRELLLARLEEDPPEGFARWNGKLLAHSRPRTGAGLVANGRWPFPHELHPLA